MKLLTIPSGVLEILRVGFSGLTFLLALLSFTLIYNKKGDTYSIIAFMILTIFLSALNFMSQPSGVMTSAPVIEYGDMYPDIVKGINGLLKTKPYVYRNRRTQLDFSEIKNEKKLFIEFAQTTEVLNPSEASVEQPHIISTSDEQFQSIKVYLADTTKPENKGVLLWQLSRDEYLRLPFEQHGNARQVAVGTLSIPPHQSVIIESKYTTKKSFEAELALLTGRVITDEFQVVVNSKKMRTGFNPGVLKAASSETVLKTVTNGSTNIIYILKGVQFPGQGLIVDWKYEPS